MSDRDTITLPREVVEKAVKAFENGCPPTCEKGMVDSGGFHPWSQPALVPCPACLAFEHLRTYLAAEQPKHPGYIIGSHWLETAYSRVCAGEAEADVLRDCGWERVDEALRRDAERLWEALKHYGKHDDDCGDHDAYNSESLRHCGCGLDAVLDEMLGEKR